MSEVTEFYKDHFGLKEDPNPEGTTINKSVFSFAQKYADHVMGDEIIKRLAAIEISLQALAQPASIYTAVPVDENFPNCTVIYNCGLCGLPVQFGQNHICP